MTSVISGAIRILTIANDWIMLLDLKQQLGFLKEIVPNGSKRFPRMKESKDPHRKIAEIQRTGRKMQIKREETMACSV